MLKTLENNKYSIYCLNGYDWNDDEDDEGDCHNWNDEDEYGDSDNRTLGWG